MRKNTFRVIATPTGSVVWIKLTQGKETCIDLVDWPAVQEYRWHTVVLKTSGHYANTNKKVGNRFISLRLHTLITGATATDHEDGNGLNNRRRNLRPCTASQNGANRGPNPTNTSGFKGVHWHNKLGKWRATIGVGRKRIALGCFSNIIAAARAYNEAAVKYFGQFAKLNPI